MKVNDYKFWKGRIETAPDDSTGAFDKFVQDSRSMDQEPRNMYSQGQLVQPSGDGSRPGYGGKDAATFTSGTGTGKKGIDDPKKYKIVKKYLNKIKKQKNKKIFLDWSEEIGGKKTKWYIDLSKEVQLSRDPLNKLINKVVNENFPNSYAGKNAQTTYTREMVVKSYLSHYENVGVFDGNEKFANNLKQFYQKTTDHKFDTINTAFKKWIAGDFEVDGVNRADFAADLNKAIDKWKPSSKQTRSLDVQKQITYLEKLNTEQPNLTMEQAKAKFLKANKNATEKTFFKRTTQLTQIKNGGKYVSGADTSTRIEGIEKGDRSKWLKNSYSETFQTNYSRFIQKADRLLDQGFTAEADRLYKAAEKFFGSDGLFTKAAGQGEHPLSRIFGTGKIGYELKINSLIDGNLNQFKKLNFDGPISKLVNDYKKTAPGSVERKNIIQEIENRKKLMNILTEGPNQKGIVEPVKFKYENNKISPRVEGVPDIDKIKNFNIKEFIEKGDAYKKSFLAQGKKIGLIDESGNIIKQQLDTKNILQIVRNNKQKSITDAAIKTAEIGGFGKKIKIFCGGKASGGRIGFKNGTDVCPAATKDPEGFLKKLTSDPQIGKFFKSSKAVGIARNVARAGLNAANPFTFIGGEIFYVGLDSANSVDKGIPLGEALDKAFIFYNFDTVEKNIMAKAKEQGFDENQLNLLQSTMNLNRLDNRLLGIDKLIELDKSDYSGLTSDLSMGSEQDYANVSQQIADESQKYINSLDKMGFDLSKSESYNTGFNYLDNIFRKKTKDELVKGYDKRKRKVDPEGGFIGDAIKPIFDIQSYTQPLKYGLDIINPFTKNVPFETDRAREQRYLNEMDEKELYLYNKRRGFDLDSVLAGTSPYLDKSVQDKKEGQAILGKGLFQYAGGGIAGLSGGDKSGRPPESGPASQGLRSLFNNGKKR